MNTILIGNIIAFAGCLLMVAVGFIREKKKILSTQCVQFALMGMSNLILGGTTGAIANLVSLLRNLVFFRKDSSTPLKLLFVAVQLLLSAGTLGGSIISWLPVLATVLFTWFIDLKSEVMLKIVILVCQVMWLVYDYFHINYVSMAFDLLTMVSTTIGIIMIVRGRKQK